MAIECELARLFMHWKEVELMLERAATQIDRNERVGSGVSGQHSREIGQSLSFRDKARLDSFVSTNPQLSASLTERHPESVTVGSPKKFFQEHLFWKRNQVLHFRTYLLIAEAESESCRYSQIILMVIDAVCEVRQIIVGLQGSKPKMAIQSEIQPASRQNCN
jgi:hypothetical protein